jgi:hypothetical protein
LSLVAVVGEQPRLALAAAALADHLAGLGEHDLVHVAQADDLGVRGHLEEAEQGTLAVPAGADDPDPQWLVGGAGVVAAGEGQPGGGGLQEVAAVHGVTPGEKKWNADDADYTDYRGSELDLV